MKGGSSTSALVESAARSLTSLLEAVDHLDSVPFDSTHVALIEERGHLRPEEEAVLKPAAEEVPGQLREQLAEEFLRGRAAASDILTQYFTLAYARHGNYQRTARALGVDRRTVKSKVDKELLAELQSG